MEERVPISRAPDLRGRGSDALTRPSHGPLETLRTVRKTIDFRTVTPCGQGFWDAGGPWSVVRAAGPRRLRPAQESIQHQPGGSSAVRPAPPGTHPDAPACPNASSTADTSCGSCQYAECV